MADIALKSSNASTQTGNNTRSIDIEESFEQATLPLAANTDELTPVYIDSNGKFAKADGSAAGTAKVYGVTTRKAKAGEPVTAIRRGVVGGLDLSAKAYGSSLFLSDTEGRIADAVGTVKVKLGEVMPGGGQVRGASAPKLFRVEVTYIAEVA